VGIGSTFGTLLSLKYGSTISISISISIYSVLIPLGFL
jgi:hypothetical protein